RGAGRDEPRLQVPAGAGAQPLDAEVERAHQLEVAAQLLGLVAIEGDVERAAGLVAGLQLAVAGELGGETGPGSGGGQREAHPRLLAPAGFADRGEHARRHVRGSRARVVALEHANPHAAPRRPPCTREPDRPPTDHDGVRRLHAPVWRARSLQRHDDVVALLAWPLGVVGHGRLPLWSPLTCRRAFRATIPAPALPG